MSWRGECKAWFDRTEPGERGRLVAVVLLGLIAAPVMLFSVVVLGVALGRLVSGRGAGPLPAGAGLVVAASATVGVMVTLTPVFVTVLVLLVAAAGDAGPAGRRLGDGGHAAGPRRR